MSHSKAFVNAIVDVSIAYEVDVTRAVEVLETVGKCLCDGNQGILTSTRVVGLLEFGGSEIV